MLREGNVSAPVFCTRTGEHIGKSNLIRQVFKPIIKASNDAAASNAKARNIEPDLLPVIRFLDLRHSHATILLGRGYSIKAVSQRLGHHDINVTLRHYQRVLPSDDAKLAEGLEIAFG